MSIKYLCERQMIKDRKVKRGRYADRPTRSTADALKPVDPWKNNSTATYYQVIN
jgi:hypothetical protein